MIKRYFLVFLVYFSLAIAVTWPLILHLSNFTVDKYDGLLNTWMLNWTIHSLTSGWQGIINYYNANIFYPYHNTFAFSDFHLALGILALPIVLWTKEPLTAYNFSILLNLTLAGFSVFTLTAYLTKNHRLSAALGFLFALSPVTLGYLPHQQVFSVWLPVFCLYFLLRRKSFLFVLFFILSSLTYVLNFYILAFLAVFYTIVYQEWKRPIRDLVTGVVFTVPFLIPFYLVSKEFNYVRPIKDTIHFSFYLPDLVTPHETGYLGISLLVLLIALCVFIYQKRRVIFTNLGRNEIFFALILVLSLIMALGPGLHVFRNTVHIGPLPILPLPYTAFYYLIPGFRGFRTPSRWMLIFCVALVVLSGMVFKKARRLLPLFILMIFSVLELPLPLQFTRVPSVKEFPPEQIWLKNNLVGAPIIQFPIYNWSDQPGFGQETLREYYSTIHWHPMFNGYSGFSPPEWEQRVFWLQKNFPSNEATAFLREKKIKLILTPVSWSARMSAYPDFKLVQSFSDTNIYEL